MAVWLKFGQLETGFEHGVIRQEDFAQLCSMVEAAKAIEHEVASMLAIAKLQAQQIVAAAVADSERTRKQAEHKYKTGFDQGFGDGVKRATEQWTSTAIKVEQSDRQAMERKTDRMAQLVTQAVQLIVESEDSIGLYKRALRTVVKSVGDVSTLTLRVSEGEQACAQRAIDEIVAQLNCQTNIDVVADSRVRVGACLFESDQGSVDASLDVQIEAIRRAVSRAVKRASTAEVANAPTMSQASSWLTESPESGRAA
jgi:type III secretion protein L